MVTATVVIPWRDTGDEHRRRNLEFTSQHLAALGWPIILGDSQHDEFNRSAARNAGVAQTDADIVILCDADVFCDLERIREAVNLAEQTGELIYPYRRVSYLDDHASAALIARGKRTRAGAIERTSLNAAGGINVIRRDHYLALGGYDETFVGWGHEDLDFAERAATKYGRQWGRGDAFHLWHPPAKRDRRTKTNKTRRLANAAIDIVYRVRSGDNNEELRYSLRSLANIPHGNVWIVGHKPSWVTDEVNHIPGNLHPTKWPNVYDNLRIACQQPEISDPFLLLDDDMYLMHQTTVGDLPNWTRGRLAEQVKTSAGDGLWAESLRNTFDYLTGIGIADPISYERHIPYLVHKQQMLAALDAARNYSWPVPPQWRTLDGNINHRPSEVADDVKIKRGSRAIPTTSPLLSTDDNSFYRIQPILQRAFPDPSKYERVETSSNPALDFYRAALRRRGTPTQRARAV